MKGLTDFIKWFLYITASILLVCAVAYSLSGETTTSTTTLWNILLAGFLTTIVTIFLYPRGYDPDKVGKTRNPLYRLSPGGMLAAQFLIHYATLCVVMIFCGWRFGWVNLNARGILGMMVEVAVVYILTFGAYYLIELKEADKMNRRLKEQYREEE